MVNDVKLVQMDGRAVAGTAGAGRGGTPAALGGAAATAPGLTALAVVLEALHVGQWFRRNAVHIRGRRQRMCGQPDDVDVVKLELGHGLLAPRVELMAGLELADPNSDHDEIQGGDDAMHRLGRLARLDVVPEERVVERIGGRWPLARVTDQQSVHKINARLVFHAEAEDVVCYQRRARITKRNTSF